MSNGNEIPREDLDLQERNVISPPIIAEPLYACGASITLLSFIPHANIQIKINSLILINQAAGQPGEHGQRFELQDPLEGGDKVEARQQFDGMLSDWCEPVYARDHMVDYPAGLPRPVINPAPVYECGLRTGVSNLLVGSIVWITADTHSERGRVVDANEQQGVDVNPAYGEGERIEAHAALCNELSPPSVTEVALPAPETLPTPTIADAYEGQEMVLIENLINGCQVSLIINGAPYSTARCWGGSLEWYLGITLHEGDLLEAVQTLCGVDSQPGTTGILACSDLPAPQVAPCQVGDRRIYLTQHVPGARIKVYINYAKVGDSGGSIVELTRPIQPDDIVHVLQILGDCIGQTVRHVERLCVAPHVTGDPTCLNLFPVGCTTYESDTMFGFIEKVDTNYDGVGDVLRSFSLPVKGTVYYPAESDGADTPFNERLGVLGAPILFIAHGMHGSHRPAQNWFVEEKENGVVVKEKEIAYCAEVAGNFTVVPNYEGYDFLQRELARMGIIAVSIDQNEFCCFDISGKLDIKHRGDFILDNIDHFKTLNDDPGSRFYDKIDFSCLGLLGHSRGGDAVLRAAEILPAYATLQSVLALAPTNYEVNSGAPSGFEFMTILPAADGDVCRLDGQTFYDQARPRTFRSQVYLHYGCHNYFNRQWLADDGIPYGRLGHRQLVTRRDHERVLSAYGCALFRATLLQDNAMLKYLTGFERPSGIPNEHVNLSFEWNDQSRIVVDNRQQNHTIDKNTLAQPLKACMLELLELPFKDKVAHGEVPAAEVQFFEHANFFGDTTGLVIRPPQENGYFRSSLGDPQDLRNGEVWVRAAEVRSSENHFDNYANDLGFQLGLEDANRVLVWVDSDMVGGLPRLFNRVDESNGHIGSKPVLNTLRFPAACFRQEEREWADVDCVVEFSHAQPPELDLSQIVAILIRYNRQDDRAIALDDLQIVWRNQ